MSDIQPASTQIKRLQGADGLRLVAGVSGPEGGRTVLMLHGGGQNRHAWRKASESLAARGLRVVALDSRGHGDSDWSPDSAYALADVARDVLEVLKHSGPPAVVVGASMGGLAGMLAAAAGGPRLVSGLVLVDVVPRVESVGGARIREFMAGSVEGFDTLDEAGDAVAAYLPHRTRPKDSRGLKRNLRQRSDGRWYWHWDPRVVTRPDENPVVRRKQLDEAAAALLIPVLLVHGALSDVVTERGIDELRELVPQLQVVSIPKAAHTAAGDDNGAFTEAVVAFC